jgi:hypothetical protein
MANDHIREAKKKIRLIDANAMREDWLENGENEYVYDTNAVLASIDAQPTVEAVEVVRCKDCEWYNATGCCEGFGWCEHFDGGMMDNDFCSHAERKDNG